MSGRKLGVDVKASDLIKQASGKKHGRTVPPALLAELRKVVEHNDSAPVHQRVSSADACKLLTEGGYSCTTLATLVVVCRNQLGRTSWATP